MKRTEQPTRDVLVTRTEGGERTFAGFGKAKANGVAGFLQLQPQQTQLAACICWNSPASTTQLALWQREHQGTLEAPVQHRAQPQHVAAEYADCFIDPGALPVEALQGADLLVTGTLGLAYPMTADAMHRSVELARSSGKCQVPAELLELSVCGAGA